VATDPDEIPPGPPFDENELVIVAEERLAEYAVKQVASEFPEVGITTKVVAGSGGMALVNESARAGLVTVGARGAGGFDGLLVGSVAAQVSKHARCPVVVVRGRAGARRPGQGPILVGVDGTPSSADALGFGFDEAVARGARLIAVHVWSVPDLLTRSTGAVWSQRPRDARTQMDEAAGEVLQAALDGWPQKYPQVEVVSWSRHGDETARTLLEAAADVGAELIVTGSRPRDGSGIVLGSVSQALVEHAGVSVAVIEPERMADRSASDRLGRIGSGQ
jgi:nucleotide-binding universal stress UspA family protein